MRYSLLFSLALSLLAVIFALQNPQTMAVNLLFFQTTGSTALVLILTFGFGVLVGLVSTIPGRLRTRRKLKALQAQARSDNADQSSSSGAQTAPASDE